MFGKDAITITGLEERIKKFSEGATDSPEMRKKINEIISQTLASVRASLARSAQSGLQMSSDPRQAYRAIRRAVYRKIFGGQVNILPSRKAGPMRLYVPPSTRTGNIGGNRRSRSERTTDIMSYTGKDRGFILRFLNAGTQDRKIRFKEDSSRGHIHRGSCGGNVAKYGKTVNTGYRGHIAGRNWFGDAAQRQLEFAANNIDKLIDQLIAEQLT